MQRLITTTAALAACLSLSAGAAAQSTEGWSEYQNWDTVERAGDWRLSVSGSLSFGETDIDGGGSFDTDVYTLDTTVGYFLDASNEIGFDLGVLGIDVEGDDATIFSLRPRYAFHFAPQGPVDPYLGARFGFSTIDVNALGVSADDTGFTVGAFGGINFFVSESVSIFTELGYDYFDFDGFKQEDIRLSLGVALFF